MSNTHYKNYLVNCFAYNDAELIKELERPFKYITSASTTIIKDQFMKTLNYWLQVPKSIEEQVSEIAFILHNAYLILDDMQDDTDLRRGQPTAHTIFGLPQASLSYGHNMLLAQKKITKLNHPKAFHIFQNAYTNILRGQTMEIYWRENLLCPTEDEYKIMASKKISELFLLVCSLMQLFSSTNVKLEKMIFNLGIYFQISDDYQNLKNDLYYENKGFCEDITEGKFGFPVVHAINKYPEKAKDILDILQQRTRDAEAKKHCISLLEQCGSFVYTMQVLEELKIAIFEDYRKLEHNPYFEKLFHMLGQFTDFV